MIFEAPSPERAAQMQEAREAKRLKVAEAKNRPWLVIGIDFGVTFTVGSLLRDSGGC